MSHQRNSILSTGSLTTISYEAMESDSPTELYITTSDNDSLKSYGSSLNSTQTKSSLQSKVKNILNRKRSQSLQHSLSSSASDVYSNSSQTSSSAPKLKLLRNKSLASLFPTSIPSLGNSSNSSRDNSISSLSDVEHELATASPLTPLSRIEEHGGMFANYQIPGTSGVCLNSQQTQEQIQRIKSLKKQSLELQPSEHDLKMYDDIADTILRKVSVSDQTPNSAEWKF